mmetsp:Transcript_107149/g.189482  ORF Transcript_107149/g.189482 Transcript_107149/m.189482 type:complete len:105 (+) Transcript_107149:85-399(+)
MAASAYRTRKKGNVRFDAQTDTVEDPTTTTSQCACERPTACKDALVEPSEDRSTDASKSKAGPADANTDGPQHEAVNVVSQFDERSQNTFQQGNQYPFQDDSQG